ncbi:MAG TPA: extracellular solute-binding protein [Xanthobacteraceae bacterium]|nr:extracellular solute-binding protein [Xanthobacteraceae bacterium]
MARISRRAVLKSTGGLAAILATGRAPAYAQGAAIHWLRWNDFVPASDQLLRKEIAAECQKALGIKLNLETINGNDIQARITAAVQSGSGPDIVCALNNWPQLYGESTVDVSEVADELGTAQGGFYETSKTVANDGKRWIAVPWCIVGLQIAYRKAWFAEVGYDGGKFPQTWEEYRAAGKKLKAKGRPLGQTLGHTFGDAPAFIYPYLWSWGGKEVEADGKTVVLDSKETVESVKFMVGFWKDAHDEGGLAWDDSSNNRAFLSGTCAATNNGASIYIEALKKPDAYQTENGTPLKDDILHAPLPQGPGGQFSFHVPFSNMVMAYSKNQKPAKEFLRWITSKPVYDPWFVSQKGFSVGATTDWEKHKLWNDDPVMLPFKAAARTGRFAGYAGPSGRHAAEALTKYILTDMYAKAVQGMAPEESVKAAHAELVKIYA